MKKMFEKFGRRKMIFAYCMLGLIVTLIVVSGGFAIAGGLALAVAVPALTDEETEFLAQVKGAINAEVDKFSKGYITETRLKEFVAGQLAELQAKGISKEEFESLKASVEANGLKLEQINGGRTDENKTIKEQISDNIELLKKAVRKEVKEVEFTINKTAVTRSSVANSTDAMRLMDIGQLATRKLVARDVFTVVPVGANSNGVIRYADWDDATKVRAAAMVAEGGTFPESTAAWEEFTLDLKKIGDTIPVTEETLMDAGRFAAELNLFLETNVNLVEDTELTTGDGTGNHLKGYYTSANTYTAAASGITDANVYDLIIKMIEDMVSTGGSKYTPNSVFMPISVINLMKLKKDSNNNYVMPPFVTSGGKNIDGLMVIETEAMGANTLVVADSRFGKIYEVEGYSISTGYVNDQFTKDLMTLKAKKREALLIREADKGAFLKCTDVAAALVTLAT